MASLIELEQRIQELENQVNLLNQRASDFAGVGSLLLDQQQLTIDNMEEFKGLVEKFVQRAMWL